MPYKTKILDNDARLPTEPTPTEHRTGTGVPAVDAANPLTVDPCCVGFGWSSCVAVWRRAGGLPTASLDLQVLLWDPILGDWDEGATITGVVPGQLVVFPVAGCRFFIKIVGVTDVIGITSWQLLLRPWESM